MSVKLDIDLGRAGEASVPVHRRLTTFACSGETITYRTVNTGRLGARRFDVFFWNDTADPDRLHFLGIWTGRTARDAIDRFKKSRRCKR